MHIAPPQTHYLLAWAFVPAHEDSASLHARAAVLPSTRHVPCWVGELRGSPLHQAFATRRALWIWTWPLATAGLATTGARMSSFQWPGKADLSRAPLRTTDHARHLYTNDLPHMPDWWGVAENHRE